VRARGWVRGCVGVCHSVCVIMCVKGQFVRLHAFAAGFARARACLSLCAIVRVRACVRACVLVGWRVCERVRHPACMRAYAQRCRGPGAVRAQRHRRVYIDCKRSPADAAPTACRQPGERARSESTRLYGNTIIKSYYKIMTNYKIMA
jgi:hypothetical protein